MCSESDIPVRSIDLPVMGSEGITLCGYCELAIVEFIRKLQDLVGRGHMTGFKKGRKKSNEGGNDAKS